MTSLYEAVWNGGGRRQRRRRGASDVCLVSRAQGVRVYVIPSHRYTFAAHAFPTTVRLLVGGTEMCYMGGLSLAGRRSAALPICCSLHYSPPSLSVVVILFLYCSRALCYSVLVEACLDEQPWRDGHALYIAWRSTCSSLPLFWRTTYAFVICSRRRLAPTG
jgi:hypothetical protein